MPALELYVDDRALRTTLERLAQSLEDGFEKPMKASGLLLSRSIDITWRQGGRPERWDPLKATTVRARRVNARRTGRRPVAGDNAKLRVSDRARKAAIATREGASGSAYSQGPHHVDVGIDTTQVPYIRRAAGLSPRGTKTPLRNPVVMQESDRPAVVNLFAADLQARVKKAERGQL